MITRDALKRSTQTRAEHSIIRFGILFTATITREQLIPAIHQAHNAQLATIASREEKKHAALRRHAVLHLPSAPLRKCWPVTPSMLSTFDSAPTRSRDQQLPDPSAEGLLRR